MLLLRLSFCILHCSLGLFHAFYLLHYVSCLSVEVLTEIIYSFPKFSEPPYNQCLEFCIWWIAWIHFVYFEMCWREDNQKNQPPLKLLSCFHLFSLWELPNQILLFSEVLSWSCIWDTFLCLLTLAASLCLFLCIRYICHVFQSWLSGLM